jgi:hypothetical protein
MCSWMGFGEDSVRRRAIIVGFAGLDAGKTKKSPDSFAVISGTLAQLVEQRTFNPFVVGSTPARPTIYSIVVDIDTLTTTTCTLRFCLWRMLISARRLVVTPFCHFPDARSSPTCWPEQPVACQVCDASLVVLDFTLERTTREIGLTQRLGAFPITRCARR